MSAIPCSVIIPHYGAAEPTASLVRQLLPQVQAVGGELIVVDDCSPDPLTGIAGARILRRLRNGGFGTAVNDGARASTGRYLVILNSDLTVGPTVLRDLLAASERWQPAVVAPRVVTPGHPGATTFDFPRPFTAFAQLVAPVAARRTSPRLARLLGEDRPTGQLSDHCADWVSGAALVIPAEDFGAAGGFDDGYHMYFEEVDLQRRLRERGVVSVQVTDVRVEHAGFGSSALERRRRWHLDSQRRYATTWGWPRRLWLAQHAGLAVTLAYDLVRRAAGREVAPWSTYRAHLLLVRESWASPLA